MKSRLKQSIFSLLCLVLCFTSISEIKAQDKGPPALQTTAFYTAGGGAGGAALGAAIWLMDPLNPNSDFKQSALTGFAIGALVGAVIGGLQLRQQLSPIQTQTKPADEIIQGRLYLPPDEELMINGNKEKKGMKIVSNIFSTSF